MNEEETNFLNNLLAGLDADDILNSVPTPVTTPAKKRQRPKSPVKSPEKENWSAQDLENVGWDWDIDLDDIVTPTKRKTTTGKDKSSSPKKTILPPFPVDSSPSQKSWSKEPVTRCIVLSVQQSNSFQKHLAVSVASDPTQTRTVILADDWSLTPVAEGDIINIIGAFSTCAANSSELQTITISSKANLLVHHPDLLITATALSNATSCVRKPLLSSMLKSTTAGGDGTTPSLIWGNMVHEVVQEFLEYKLDALSGKTIRTVKDGSWLEEKIEKVVNAGLLDLFKISVDVEQAKREVRMRVQGLMNWVEKYISKTPNADAMLSDTRATAATSRIVAITGLHAIEEDIWSPKYGLKGIIDATVAVSFQDAPPPKPIPSSNSKLSAFFPRKPANPEKRVHEQRIAPLEIKTGRSIGGMEHRAQTMLYTLLTEVRYHQPVEGGLLYYTQGKREYQGPKAPQPPSSASADKQVAPEAEQVVLGVPRNRNEIKALMQRRNEMAGWLMKRVRKVQRAVPGSTDDLDDADGAMSMAVDKLDSTQSKADDFLPDCIDDERACSSCFAVDACMLFRKALSHPTSTPSLPGKLSDIFENKTSHLTPERCEFFRKWEELISLEEQDQMRFKKEIWTLGAEEREKRGRCFAGMRVMHGGKAEDEVDEAGAKISKSGWSKFQKYRFTFTRHSQAAISTVAVNDEEGSEEKTEADDPNSLLNGHITVGDAVTVSIEPHLIAFTRGFVLALTPREVMLAVEMDISEEAIRARLAGHPTDNDHDRDQPLTYRIDRDEVFVGMARVRDNLAQVFYAHGDTRRLELVVDLKKPEFWEEGEEVPGVLPPPPQAGPAQDSSSTPSLPRAGCPLPPQVEEGSHLNASQQEAVTRVLRAKDYALILGMPGTGKTTVIADIVRRLVGMGKSVLITSYTHSAVDNILAKVSPKPGCGDGVREDLVLRIGNEDKVHPDARRFTLGARPTARSLEMLERQLMQPQVVATTCLSIDHALFSRRSFNYCIVDEASQITLPTCLGPLRFADKFILVGDHFQLPPLVRNRQARQGGLELSLFRMLSDAHPHAVVDLTEQYRMNEDIMCLSNKLIYGDRLRCGDEKTRTKSLKLPDGGAFVRELHAKADSHEGTCWIERVLDEGCKVVFVDTDGLPAPDARVGNLVQNPTEAELVRQLTESLILSGVPQDQIGVITLYRQQIKLLSAMLDGRPQVEIMTADRSQGRDKEVVLISLVRSNEEGRTGDLVKDWRRMNVSFTRAKSKLVIFGSRSTLKTTTLLNEFFELVQGKGWILELGKDDEKLHHRSIPWLSSHTAKSLGLEDLRAPLERRLPLRSDSERTLASSSGPVPTPPCSRWGSTSTIAAGDGASSTPSPSSSKRSRPSSQVSKDDDESDDEVEVVRETGQDPRRARKAPRRSLMREDGLTKSRPILLDLLNDDK